MRLPGAPLLAGLGLLAATVANALPAAVSDDPFGGKSLPLLLGLVFVSGLALNLTPCVYPLIPITLGYFGRQSGGQGAKTFGLAAAYVLGMSVTYSALGVFAAYARFEREESETHWLVRIETDDPAMERSVAGELGNYALGLTIRSRGQDA